MAREFEIRREVVLPAGPDEVFEAVSTEAGNAGWLFPHDPGPEAAVESDAPRRFAVRYERHDWFNAVAFEVEGRDGGTSVLRYAHSGIFVEDWENQYDAADAHTDFYLHTLGEYLRHFAGRPVTYVGEAPFGIHGPPASTAPDAFRRLAAAIGVAPEHVQGDGVHFAPEGVDGVLDYRRPNFIGVRTPDALYRFFGRNAFGAPVGMSVHHFAFGVDAEHERRRWERWLHTTLA